MELHPDVEWVAVDDVAPVERFPGVSVRRLWRSPEGRSALVVDIGAGATWEGFDVHDDGPEEVFVVAGVFHDGVREYPAGTFVHNPAGSRHVPQSRSGCRLFVLYPGA